MKKVLFGSLNTFSRKERGIKGAKPIMREAPKFIMSHKNKNLAVGIFIDGDFIPSYNGAKNRIHYLSRYLQKIGVKVVIFYGYRGWADLKLISQEPFKTYIFPIDRYYNDLNFLANLIRKENINIIQFCDLESTLSQGIKLSQNTGAYLVSELHYVVSRLAKNLGTPPKRVQLIRQLEVATGKVVDHVICLSTNDNLELREKMHIVSSRISTIPSGVDLREIKYRGPNFKTKTALFLGNLYFEPNADAVRLINRYIYPTLNQQGFRVLIVGDYPSELRRQFQAPNFIFTGSVPNLDDIFYKTTVALAPVREGTGLRIKILNYLGAGLPVVATSAAASGMSNTKSMIIENNFKKYPKIIFDLVDNPNYALHLAISSRKLIERDFDWLIIARRTAEVYRNIISQKIKKKSRFTNLGTNLTIGKPDWLEEFERKKRFKKSPSQIYGNFSYGVIDRGKIKIIK